VKDPNDVVKAGQIGKVHVLSADPKMKRIALSMKTARAVKPVAAPALPRMEDKIASLADRWKNR
jgi:protein Tex